MEKIVEQGILYDYYGALLTEQQQRIYEEVVYNDMSLSEIAEVEGISRQAVSELIGRSTKKLRSYEEKMHLIAKFSDLRSLCDAVLVKDPAESADGTGSMTLQQFAQRVRDLI